MAVMKIFCGCCSTKSGALTILGFNLLLYIGGIVVASLRIGYSENSWTQTAQTPNECLTNSTSEYKSSWWCTAINNSSTVEYDGAIVKLAVNIILLLFTLLGIYGTTSDKSCPLLPAIIGEFFVWLLIALISLGVCMILILFSPGEIDMTTSVAILVIVVIVLVFLFYLWLCLVSHYQILREIEKIAQDKVQIMQYPYDENAMSDPHYGDYPTARTDVSPPPEYTPPEDSEITPPEYTPPKKPIPDDPELEDISLDEKLPN